MISLYFLMIAAITLIEFIMSKKVLADRERKMSGTTVYRWYILGLVVLAVTVIIAVLTLSLSEPQAFLLFLVTLFFGFRTLMESKYIRETRRHLISFTVAATSLIFTGLLILLRII